MAPSAVWRKSAARQVLAAVFPALLVAVGLTVVAFLAAVVASLQQPPPPVSRRSEPPSPPASGRSGSPAPPSQPAAQRRPTPQPPEPFPAPPASVRALGMGFAAAAAAAADDKAEAVCSEPWADCWGPVPVLPPGDGGKDRLYAFTSLTGPHLHYCATLGSAALSGIELDIVGWQGEKGRGAWRGKAFNMTWKKIVQAEHVSAAAAKADPRAIVLYTDGGDTVVTADSADSVAAAFLKWERRTGRSFLLSAEINCYMRTLPKEGCKHPAFPWRTEPYAYPNTGVWMARAQAAHWFFRGVRRFAEARHPDTGKRLDDQAMIGESLGVVPRTREVVALDHRNDVVQNLFLAWAPWQFCYYRDASGRSRLRNSRTGGEPIVWHANGPKLFYSPQKGLGILSDIMRRGATWRHKELPSMQHSAAASQQEECARQWGKYMHPPKFSPRKYKPILPCPDR